MLRFPNQLWPGQAVQLGAGLFAELTGTFDRLDGPGAVCVLLDNMGRRVQMQAWRDLVLSAA